MFGQKFGFCRWAKHCLTSGADITLISVAVQHHFHVLNSASTAVSCHLSSTSPKPYFMMKREIKYLRIVCTMLINLH